MQYNEKINLLKDCITDIENQLKVREASKKRVFAKNDSARQYYRGLEEGAYIALRVINERIGRLKND